MTLRLQAAILFALLALSGCVGFGRALGGSMGAEVAKPLHRAVDALVGPPMPILVNEQVGLGKAAAAGITLLVMVASWIARRWPPMLRLIDAIKGKPPACA